MTREERNVLLFVALGVVLGALPELERIEDEEAIDRAVGAATEEPVVADLFPIDVNRAGPELLAELPGIGPAKAAAIVALREERGAFGSVDELADVHGIGPRTVERLRDLVTIGALDAAAGRAENTASRGRIVATTTRDAPLGARVDHAVAARERADSAEVVGGALRRQPRENGGDDRE